jgi:hypothetical protein
MPHWAVCFSRFYDFRGNWLTIFVLFTDNALCEDMLIDLFERIDSFFKCLESYTKVKSSEEMTDMMVKIVRNARFY